MTQVPHMFKLKWLSMKDVQISEEFTGKADLCK